MIDDILTRLRSHHYHVARTACINCDAADQIERLQHAVDELSSAFQTLTDMGDDCPMCWDIFKKSGQPVYCYGHAIIAELEEARRG